MNIKISYIKLIMICHNRKLKLTNICKSVGLSSNIVTNINNDIPITLESACKICLALGVNLDNIISFEEVKK